VISLEGRRVAGSIYSQADIIILEEGLVPLRQGNGTCIEGNYASSRQRWYSPSLPSSDFRGSEELSEIIEMRSWHLNTKLSIPEKEERQVNAKAFFAEALAVGHQEAADTVPDASYPLKRKHDSSIEPRTQQLFKYGVQVYQLRVQVQRVLYRLS
jgi:hypothetical protein